MDTPQWYRIINDSGVDYKFLRGFGGDKRSWLGQVVLGQPAKPEWLKQVSVQQPFQDSQVVTYTADENHFELVKGVE